MYDAVAKRSVNNNFILSSKGAVKIIFGESFPIIEILPNSRFIGGISGHAKLDKDECYAIHDSRFVGVGAILFYCIESWILNV